jgi:hypothetical protein
MAIVCAVTKDVDEDVALITGRMWNPCQISCTQNQLGGVWQNEDESLWVELRRAEG